jgi:hypothetical protein
MRKIFLTVVASLSLLALLIVHSCVKSINDGYTEPITVIQPDSLILSNVPAGTVLPIQIQFTTDRPIVWAKCLYQVDTPGATATHIYPDTLFCKVLDSLPYQYNNKYMYTGSYTVPDSAKSLTSIRFDVQFKAALNPSSTPPSIDTVFYDKQFVMTVR